jgi:hypothetical protein
LTILDRVHAKQFPNVIYLRANTQKKDSADFAIVFQASTLNLVLPYSISFGFVTSDHFVDELVSHLVLTRKCIIINPRDKHINQIQSTNELQVSLYKNNIIDKEETFRQYFFDNWKSSKQSFSKIYELDYSNFSKWLKRKKQSPASCKAVQKYMKEINDLKKEVL